MKKQQLLVINYLLRLKAIILRHPKSGRATKQHNR
jgi:hypothetical protein